MSDWRGECVRAEHPYRVAIITAKFNREYTEKLLENARQGLIECGVKERHIDEYFVPGSLELPFACKQAIKTGSYDGVIAIGVVMRGETYHFDIVANESAAGIMQVNLGADVPVVFGVLTCDTSAQVEERLGLGENFAFTCVEMMNLKLHFPTKQESTVSRLI